MLFHSYFPSKHFAKYAFIIIFFCGVIPHALVRNDINELEQLSFTDVKCLWCGDKKAAFKNAWA
jgi:hypothetical protein